ncbi:DUF1302 family protein [Solimonas sp. K1W22B-7]|uniref:DUF1302 domain-containing protein n=1 Tax=Solimonas sp. K1W22B-7 TaxID=2303331 RepID=UPI000E336FCF|nr:DUF1302 family protein [Solimonas sp. K1W22B-7]AXQ29766.1 DUF1302 family protein [Solimonas sp. K1W22B-7]
MASAPLRRAALPALAFAGLLAVTPASALNISLFDGQVEGVLNTAITYGAAWRMEDRNPDLIGKSNINPDLCTGQYQSCQALFKDQIYPSQRLSNAPGAFSMRNDDGDINYDKHDVIQQVGKITQDINLTWGEYGFFARWLAFYDFTNNDFTEQHPNRITRENVGQVGIAGDDQVSNRYFANSRVYGPGGRVRNQRNDGEVLRQVGTDLQWLDANFYGRLPLWGEKELSFKIGRQTVNWGESTLMVINSVNQAQPVNANNLYRVGFQVEEVFTPIASIFGSMELFENATVEAYYQLEWQPVEAPAPGSFFGFVDLGTNNAGDNPNLSFGGSAEDPYRAYRGDSAATQTGYLDNPLTLVTPTSATIFRDKDKEARDSGQYGLAFKYYAENFNSGTEFGFYFMNYHSKLPYVSFMSTDASCARREGNPDGIDVHNTLEYINACRDNPVFTNGLSIDPDSPSAQLLADALPLILSNPIGIGGDVGVTGQSPVAVLAQLLAGAPVLLTGGNPNATGTTRSAVALDTARIFFEYPEDLKMFGASFNTTVGDFSIQGEVAYRPDAPLQVAVADLSLAAAGPTLTRCHDPNLNCAGSTGGGSGFDENGNRIIYGSSDFIDETGTNPYQDTVNILLGHGPGSARAFPNFVIPYRGGVVGENPPNSYIRGYEEFDTFQFNFGFTQVLGATDNPFGADQIQLVGEFGAVWIPDLPGLDELQIEAPGIYTSATAGADGSGFKLKDPALPYNPTTNPYLPVGGRAQACSTNPTCNYGPDGLRFNPHQADLGDFVDKLSWGYKIITIVKYESVAPGISLQPFIIWSHDVNGTGPGPAENFVQGRKQVLANLETRYKEAISFTVGYGWFFGGGNNNLYSDRDFAQAFVRYQF